MIKKTNARHGDFYIFTNDIFISRCLDLYGEWSEAEMVVYETFIQKEHIVIEVGSHIGSFTVPIARLAKSVFAFEPQRTVFQVLNTNLITNGIHNVYSYMHAVGKEDKHLWLKEVEYEAGTMEKGFNSGGIHLKQISAENNGYPCKQITLDSFIPKEAEISFIKVDAEEMEIDVLKGATDIINKNKPVMYLESHMSNTELPEYVATFGYKIFEHIPMNFNPDNYKKNQTRVLAFDKNVEHMHDYMLLCIPNEMPFETNLKQLK